MFKKRGFKDNINFSWKSARYFDFWSINHFISGLVMGFLLLYLDTGVLFSWLIAFALGVWWEVFEYVKRVSENGWRGIIADIIYSQIGFAIVYHFTSLSPNKNLFLSFGLLIIGLFFNYLGWKIWLKKYSKF